MVAVKARCWKRWNFVRNKLSVKEMPPHRKYWPLKVGAMPDAEISRVKASKKQAEGMQKAISNSTLEAK